VKNPVGSLVSSKYKIELFERSDRTRRVGDEDRAEVHNLSWELSELKGTTRELEFRSVRPVVPRRENWSKVEYFSRGAARPPSIVGYLRLAVDRAAAG
jgi:hypothetical protein